MDKGLEFLNRVITEVQNMAVSDYNVFYDEAQEYHGFYHIPDEIISKDNNKR